MRVVEMAGPGGGWNVLVPETRRERMRGLRGLGTPGPREAMLLRRCRSVQTFGLREAISVAFLDASMQVVEVRRCRPRRVIRARRAGARHALECDPEWAPRNGERFRFSPRARAAR